MGEAPERLEETTEKRGEVTPVKIASLELENVKRVRAVALEPSQSGLTVIGGRNAQGKTSVLDAIAWALGGNRRRPERPNREGAANPAHLHVVMSNGIVVERKGKTGQLVVTDPSGRKSGQKLLDGFVEGLALDLPKFMAMPDREKADVLLGIVGIGDELKVLDQSVQDAFDERREVGRQERAKREVAEGLPSYPDAPDEPVSASDLIEQQKAIAEKNAANERIRMMAKSLEREFEVAQDQVKQLEEQAEAIASRLADAKVRAAKAADDYMKASSDAEKLVDEPTDGIEQALAEIDDINEKVRANQRRREMEAEAEGLTEKRRALDGEIESLRAKRTALLDGVEMPLEGLSVEDGRLVYKGSTWSDMSSSEQLMVATSVVRELKPECGFVLVDELEKMDPVTLAEFGAWAESGGLQVIGTRVATDGTCSVIIEDGRVVAGAELEQAAQDAPAFADAPAVAETEKKTVERPMLIPGAF